jgi:catechol 2,3-dioxygenase
MKNAKSKNTIHPKTDVGEVTLFVKDLSRMASFYVDAVGLEVLNKTNTEISLGFGENKILRLLHKKDYSDPKSGEAGLYHTAILFEHQHHLANTIFNVFQKERDAFEGSGDHFVSQAFYFRDPEGNGLELYYDRPKSEWKWQDGKILMGTEYIDPEKFLMEHLDKQKPNAKVKTGHVHLKVGDIEKAKGFYVDVLGFDITGEFPSALFISAGGYHHHLGLNIWESFNAEERSESIGLASFEILLPNAEEMENIQESLSQNHIKFEKTVDQIITKDPWGNKIVIKSI